MNTFYIIRKANDSENTWYYAHEVYTADLMKMVSGIKEAYVVSKTLKEGAVLLGCVMADIDIVSRVN